MDDSNENSTVPKIVIDQTPYSSAHSDDSGLGGESNATLDGKFSSLKYHRKMKDKYFLFKVFQQ